MEVAGWTIDGDEEKTENDVFDEVDIESVEFESEGNTMEEGVVGSAPRAVLAPIVIM